MFRLLTSLILFLISFTFFAFAEDNVEAYSVFVIKASGGILPPNKSLKEWRSIVKCELENGLKAVMIKPFSEEAKAKEDVDLKLHKFSDRVRVLIVINELPKEKKHPFKLRLENEDFEEEVSLSLIEDYDFSDLPHVVSITETPVLIWFTEEYQYVIELSDGSLWKTVTTKTPWQPWKVRSLIFCLGSNLKPCLLNLNLFWERKQHFIDRTNCLDEVFESYEKLTNANA